MNLILPEALSMDYTIFNKKLLIGTTKMTLRSIIDYELAVSAIPATTPTIQSQPSATTAPDSTPAAPVSDKNQ